jgi:hypothetical protein
VNEETDRHDERKDNDHSIVTFRPSSSFEKSLTACLVVLAVWLKKSPLPYLGFCFMKYATQALSSVNERYRLGPKLWHFGQSASTQTIKFVTRHHIPDRCIVVALGITTAVLQAIKAFQDAPTPYRLQLFGPSTPQIERREMAPSRKRKEPDLVSLVQTLSGKLAALAKAANVKPKM